MAYNNIEGIAHPVRDAGQAIAIHCNDGKGKTVTWQDVMGIKKQTVTIDSLAMLRGLSK